MLESQRQDDVGRDDMGRRGRNEELPGVGRRARLRAERSVTVPRGEKAALEFKRTTDHTCATAVVFPELSIKKDLPLNVAVAVNVPTESTRTLGFECGMGMYKSSVVIK